MEGRVQRISVGVLLFLLFFSLYSFTMTGRIRFGDEGERYLTAQSLVERHDLAIRVQPDLHRKIGIDGRNYSSYELGSVLPLVPFYMIGSYVASSFPFGDPNWVEMLIAGLLNPLVTALTVVVLYASVRALGYSLKPALTVALLFGLGTIVWPYSKAFEREPILGLCLSLAALASFRFRQTLKARWLWLLGASSGFLVFAKIANVILLPFIALYVVLACLADRPRALRRVVLAMLVFGIPVAGLVGTQAYSNLVRFGSLTDIGLAGTWGNPLSYFGLSNLPAGLIGTLFSPAKSIFLYSPPILLFIPAWFVFFKEHRLEALLIGILLGTSVVFNAMNTNWDQASWWGAKYLVPLTPLFLLPVAALFGFENNVARRLAAGSAVVLGILGLGVQVVAALVDDREYLDVTGRGIDLAGAIDWVRHGALESLVVYLSPMGIPLRVNSFGVVLLLSSAILGLALVWRWRRGKELLMPSPGLGVAALVLVALIQQAAFLLWVVAPYPEIRAAQGNTKFVSGDLFWADGRRCDARALYLIAFDRGTTMQTQGIARLEELDPLSDGNPISAEELDKNVEMPNDGVVRVDGNVTFAGRPTLSLYLPPGKEASATAVSDPFPVSPGTSYELSGWIKAEGAYGSGYAVVAVYEDDGAWEHSQGTDITGYDGTGGWRPFRKILTTLPSTHRLFVKAGLWKTYGTVWIAGLRLSERPTGSTESGPAQCPQINKETGG